MSIYFRKTYIMAVITLQNRHGEERIDFSA